MASTKSSAKTSPGKRPATVAASSTTKAKTATKAKLAAKPEPVANAKAAPKAVRKTAPAKAVSARAKKPAGIPSEKRRHYIEMAAYYIAERRGFAPGNLLDDWVQAEAEIDRLLAEGRLGS